MCTIFLTIHPHDPVIVRDARPFRDGNRMRSLDWPYPSVLAGSVRTMIAKMKSVEFTPDVVQALKKIRVWGPFAFFNDTLWFPAPNDIVMRNEQGIQEFFQVAPVIPDDLKGAGCNLPHTSLFPTLIQGYDGDDFKPGKIPPLWSVDMMVSWLTLSKMPGSFHEMARRGTGFMDLPMKESRVHSAIDPGTGSAREGMLFETMGLDFMCPGFNVSSSLAGRIEDSGDFFDLSCIDTIHPFGGKRRISYWKSGEEHYGWECPDIVRSSCEGSRFIRMVLVTPGIFTGGWLMGWLYEKDGYLEGTPPGFSDKVRLRLWSACIDRWRPLSGWNLEQDGNREKGPKPMRRLVPAGSVYFFERVDGGMDDFVKDAWLCSVCDDEQDRMDGFGISVWGAWNKC